MNDSVPLVPNSPAVSAPLPPLYVYNSELDSYIFYTSAKADTQRFNKAFRYNYEIAKVGVDRAFCLGK